VIRQYRLYRLEAKSRLLWTGSLARFIESHPQLRLSPADGLAGRNPLRA
jgi:hypothetical protein